MPWRAATACVTGSAHLKAGLPCQDAAQVEIHEAVLIGAIADGAGSAKHSDEGAQAATKACLAFLRTQTWPAAALKSELDQAMREACSRAREALQGLSVDRSLPLDDFACTLTVFAASRTWLAALQIGDGQLVVRFAESYDLIFKPDRGEYCNETTFLTSAVVDESIQVTVTDRDPIFICAATDGIERISLHYQDWAPHAAFYKPLEDFIAGAENPDAGARDIEEFLKREKLNQYTDDDKTLLLAAWRES